MPFYLVCPELAGESIVIEAESAHCAVYESLKYAYDWGLEESEVGDGGIGRGYFFNVYTLPEAPYTDGDRKQAALKFVLKTEMTASHNVTAVE